MNAKLVPLVYNEIFPGKNIKSIFVNTCAAKFKSKGFCEENWLINVVIRQAFP